MHSIFDCLEFELLHLQSQCGHKNTLLKFMSGISWIIPYKIVRMCEPMMDLEAVSLRHILHQLSNTDALSCRILRLGILAPPVCVHYQLLNFAA